MTRIPLPAAGLLLLISAHARADLRTYDVDPQYQQEVYQALSHVLVDNPQFLAPGLAMGRVQLLSSGQLLVDAAPATLAQVEEVLRAIKQRPVPPAPRVTLRYWAVLGTPAGQNGADAPATTPLPNVLRDVLTELQRFHSELAFRVVGSAAIVSESGQLGAVNGMPFRFEQTAYVQGQSLNADIQIQLLQGDNPRARQRVGELKVRAALQRGEFVVLGESTQQGGGIDGTSRSTASAGRRSSRSTR